MAPRARDTLRKGKRRTVASAGVLGAPERFAVPFVTLVVVTLALVAFGCVMIYSASSVTALASSSTNYDAAFYARRQLGFAILGIGLAVALAAIDYHTWLRGALYVVWGVTVALLVAVLTPIAGQDAYGATRWISVGGFTLQPSEFAKLTVVLTAANVFERHFRDGELDTSHLLLALGVGVVVPLVFIVAQPDKGTTIVIAATLFVMLMLAGAERRVLLMLAGIGVAGVLILTFKDDYSRLRFETMLDPWQDYYGSGWQLIQGFYAFGSGGLFGVGLGASKQKYSYLPFAYNDFIFAVVGEELGLVGTLGMLAAFGVLAWAGYRIARYAPDMAGRLIAAGFTSMIVIQLAVNVCGVLGLIPLSGKPVPFVSYGGSSVLSSLMTMGLVASVSLHSELPETEHEARRRQLRVAVDDRVDVGLSSAGEAHPRSERRPATLTLVQGGAGGVSGTGSAYRGSPGAARGTGRGVGSAGRDPRPGATRAAGAYGRIDLGPSAAERLRPQGTSRDAARGSHRSSGERRGHGA